MYQNAFLLAADASRIFGDPSLQYHSNRDAKARPTGSHLDTEQGLQQRSVLFCSECASYRLRVGRTLDGKGREGTAAWRWRGRPRSRRAGTARGHRSGERRLREAATAPPPDLEKHGERARHCIDYIFHFFTLQRLYMTRVETTEGHREQPIR